MNITDLKDWGTFINLVATAVIGFVFWLTNRDKVTNERITHLESDIGDQFATLTERQTKLEARVNVVPTHDDLHQQYEAMLRQTEKLDQLIGRMEAREKIIDAMHHHLLEKS